MMVRGEVSEIFISIQGEGMFVGVRQLFVRFSRCNLRCWYCDTKLNREFCMDYVNNRKLKNPVDADYISDVIGKNSRIHSVALTGGEPMLYADFIRKINFHGVRVYLESNMSLPDEAKKLRFVDFVAGDLKVREAFDADYKNYEEILDRTVKSFKILKNTSKRVTFCKIVLPGEFNSERILSSASEIKDYVCAFILQPVYGVGVGREILDLQEKLIELRDTRIIPQVHKLIGLR